MILQDIQKISPEIELWWDSLPDTCDFWRGKIIRNAPPDKQEAIGEELARFFTYDSPDSLEPGGLKGVTSNPRLVWESVEIHQETWAQFVKASVNNGIGDEHQIYWELYQSIYRENSRLLLPLWERTNGRHGWICAQVLPPSSFDTAAMFRQGMELAAINPNLMIKVVGSKQGFETIEFLTSLGVATNFTLSFSLPQVRLALRALKNGLEKARRRGVRMEKWRAVITFMAGRLGAEELLRKQAEERGINLTPELTRWVELLTLKEIYRLIARENHLVKLLVCSLKADFRGDLGNCLHIEKSAGANCIYTFPPQFLADLLQMNSLTLDPASITEAVPTPILDLILKIPYVRQVYESDGMSPEEFNIHPVFEHGLRDVDFGYQKTLDFIRRYM